mmetsp:Transcript_11740/g.14175  ORF Transcript_11740/g.14175 Transcript_11740/m.14175 type:complete len:89 (+) Transcript_11740:230-496(+)
MLPQTGPLVLGQFYWMDCFGDANPGPDSTANVAYPTEYFINDNSSLPVISELFSNKNSEGSIHTSRVEHGLLVPVTVILHVPMRQQLL